MHDYIFIKIIVQIIGSQRLVHGYILKYTYSLLSSSTSITLLQPVAGYAIKTYLNMSMSGGYRQTFIIYVTAERSHAFFFKSTQTIFTNQPG